jgi:hypothetical protein
METEIWASFQASRGANATLFLGVIISLWVAARFSSVMVEKEAPAIGRVLCTIFGLSVFLMNFTLMTNVVNQWTVHANAMAALGDAVSPIAAGFVAEYGGEMATMPHPIVLAFLVSGLLITVLPLWMQPNK